MENQIDNIGEIGKTAKLICAKETFNFGQIIDMVDQIRELINKYSFMPIGIILPRNKYLIPAIFACINQYSPFLLVDSTLPKERIIYMLRNSQCKCILTVSTFSLYPFYIKEASCGECILCVSQKINSSQLDGSILYHQYTSGSTGEPKGIEISRKAMNNFIIGIVSEITLTPIDIFACLTAVSFDIFLLESIVAIHLGMTVCLCEDEVINNPRKVVRWIKSNRINILQLTPSRMKQLLYIDKNLNFLLGVKKILLGGERLPDSLLISLQQNSKSRIYNLYGPTETTVWSSVADLTFSNQVHIGKPILNTKFKILAPDSVTEIAKGSQGEICISGAGLANRYINNEGLTQKSFIYLDNGERIYRTGDLGIEIAKNKYLCLGRIDNQVKIRGHRVELEEIEHISNMYPEIIDTVTFMEKRNDIDILTLVYIPLEQRKLNVESFICFIKSKLPTYMIPNRYIEAKEIFLNSNGKKDRKRMKALYGEDENGQSEGKSNWTF